MKNFPSTSLQNAVFSLVMTIVLTSVAAGHAAAGRRPAACPAKDQNVKKVSPEYYELIIYHLKDKQQEQSVDQYLAETYLPYLHHSGIKSVGAFKTAGIDTAADKRIYVLIAYPSLASYAQLTGAGNIPPELLSKSTAYSNAAYNDPPFIRKESVLMKAFSGAPLLKRPAFSSPAAQRIYELRSYEGPTEQLYRNKLKMFNEGNEMEIFERIGSQPVFYGEVLAGGRMPNLMYMTSYSDQKSRDAHWSVFGNDPRWKQLSSEPSYQHNVSRADILFLVPAAYSDF